MGIAAAALAVLLYLPATTELTPPALLCVPIFVALVHLCFDWRVALLAVAATIASLAALAVASPGALAAVAGSALLLILTLEWRNRQSVQHLFRALALSRGRSEALWVVDHRGRVIAANDRAWQLGEDRAPVALGSSANESRLSEVSHGNPMPAPDGFSVRAVPLPSRAATESCSPETSESDARPQDADRAAGMLADAPIEGERVALMREIEQLQKRTARLEGELRDTRTHHTTLSQKMRGKEELLSLVSHDLRSALNAMVGWLYLARSPNASIEGRDRALEGIASAVSTQRRLVEQLLDASRLLSGKRHPESVPVDSGALLRRIEARFKARAHDRALDFRVEHAESAPIFNADPGRVEESVATLVEQAIAVAPDNGRIQVNAHACEIEGIPWAVIEVDALGARLSDDAVDDVLAGAITGRPTEQVRGSSLGLPMAIARAVTELQGGQLALQSMGDGAGTRMSLKFPLRSRQAAGEAPLQTRDSGPTHSSAEDERPQDARPDEPAGDGEDIDIDPAEAGMLIGTFILLVDDMDDMLDVTAALLQGYGAHVTTARSASEALSVYPEWASGGGERVVISDLSMPGRDGLDLIREIRRVQAGRRMPRVPAVAFSAQADLYSRRSVIEAGFDLYLAKPISPRHLVSAISTLIGR